MNETVLDTTSPIVTEKSDRLLTITLNRPDKLNAFNDAMHEAFHRALQRAYDEADIHAVLICGAGRAFCAGQDLGDRNPDAMDTPPDLSATLTTYYNPAIKLIRDLPKPVVAAVGGVAAGAGANLALACDLVLAGQSARFIQSFAKVGLIPDAGGSWMLPRLIGEARAKALAMTAMPLGAQQAEEWGLIYKCLPDEALMREARALAGTLAQGATFGLGLMKTAIHAAAQNDLDTHLGFEAQLQGKAGRSADYAEGVRAFLQKRAPEFKGK